MLRRSTLSVLNFANISARAQTEGDVTSRSLPALVLLTSVALSVTGSARAWDPAPLCAMEGNRAREFVEPLASFPEVADAPEDPIPVASPAAPTPAIPGGSICGPWEPLAPQQDLAPAAGRHAWEMAEAALAREDWSAALLHLEVVASALPAIADDIELRRAEVALRAGDLASARRSFARARDLSEDATLIIRAKVGYVRALLRLGHRDAIDELGTLRRRYPSLPQLPELMLELGSYHEGKGRPGDAAQTYRRLDVTDPGSRVAAEARARLSALAARAEIREHLAPVQRVERVERYFRHGPISGARAEVATLLADEGLASALRARVLRVAANLARHEGRFDDARAHDQERVRFDTTLGADDEEETARERERMADTARAAASRDLERARTRLSNLRGRGPLRRIGTTRLVRTFYVAADAGLRAELAPVAAELLRRDLRPGLRLDLALRGNGVLEDTEVLEWLAPVAEREGELGLRARYFRAQALARLGHFAEAEATLLEIQREGGYYGQWAHSALRRVRAGLATGTLGAAPTSETRFEGRAPNRVFRPIDPPAIPTATELVALAKRLEPLAREHGAAFPWIARASAYLHLGEREAAGHELYEAFLAYRRARGRSIPYAGLESIAKEARRGRRAMTGQERAARRALPDSVRAELVDVAEKLDAFGAATGFGGLSAINARPRAHAALVEAAAAHHGLDPNLLFAIMRVESVYQAEIVSYAGAIGLCQIMPRTGRLIARARGIEDFTIDQLLDPGTNLDFAAWYLRSLVDRFDGRLPLAIASYNGGPHNVRRWLGDHPSAMPVDAFLEQIPFTQTHRYVRRVLTHYAAYRAQVGLPPAELSNVLPGAEPDSTGF